MNTEKLLKRKRELLDEVKQINEQLKAIKTSERDIKKEKRDKENHIKWREKVLLGKKIELTKSRTKKTYKQTRNDMGLSGHVFTGARAALDQAYRRLTDEYLMKHTSEKLEKEIRELLGL